MRFKSLIFTSLLLAAQPAICALPIGQVAPAIKLSGDDGGRVDGKAWDSSELKAKVHLLVYSAPSAKDLNNKATEAIKDAKFSRENFASVAVVNMAASMIPNFLIEKSIASKQEDYPQTVYVKDFDKALVKKWNLADKSNCMMLFDKDGKVLFSVDGELNDKQISEIIDLIKNNI